MVQQEIKFTPNTSMNITLYFDADYFYVGEIPDEVNKFIRDNFLYRNNSIEFDGDWTRVPVIRRKWRLVQDSSVWDE